MTKIVSANQKGGVGKTALVVNMSYYFALKRGYRVLVLDLDTQADTSYTFSDYSLPGFVADNIFNNRVSLSSFEVKSGDIVLIEATKMLGNVELLDTVVAIEKLGNFFNSVNDLFDYCFIDTNSCLSVKLAAALACSDYVICPVEMEPYSLKGVKTMATVIKNVKNKYNPHLHLLGLVPSRVLNIDASHIYRLETLSSAYPDRVTPYSISELKAYSEALGQKIPVWDVEDKKLSKMATDEISDLGDFLINRMEAING